MRRPAQKFSRVLFWIRTLSASDVTDTPRSFISAETLPLVKMACGAPLAWRWRRPGKLPVHRPAAPERDDGPPIPPRQLTLSTAFRAPGLLQCQVTRVLVGTSP